MRPRAQEGEAGGDSLQGDDDGGSAMRREDPVAQSLGRVADEERRAEEFLRRRKLEAATRLLNGILAGASSEAEVRGRTLQAMDRVDDVFLSVLGLYAERARASGNDDLSVTLAELYTYIVGEVAERHPPAIRLMDDLCEEPDAGKREKAIAAAFSEGCSARSLILTATELLRRMDGEALAMHNTDEVCAPRGGGEGVDGGGVVDPQLYAKLCVIREEAMALAPARTRSEIFEGGMRKNGIPEDDLDALRSLLAEERREVAGLAGWPAGRASLGGILEAIEGVSLGIREVHKADGGGGEGSEGPALEAQLLMQSSSANDTLPRLERIRASLVERALLDAKWSAAAP